ncbi:sulfite exporter TauE/SafE family protein [Demequina capsici]|uniref:Probable membrane transporter protein n=1 Tax=Demequina capsici TaxID=3075620 RepID=A0AA96FCG1_9MICO|nr:sulfite exporter TauE/SafE family protein [Demequina sp. OYTSA14]WNM25976.1 sulfite exporter TauE/SafE family protein [Demequina sp. OYTSA14]
MTLARPSARVVLTCIGVGLLAGLMSGLFGVGGGIVTVPLLTLVLGFDHRRAAGTSLAAIVPTAAVGVVSYASHGSVAWVAALILAVAAVVGAQLGTWLLHRLPLNALRWGFVGFLAVVAVMLFVVVPSRDAGLHLTWLSGLGLVVVGLASGVLSGLLGVGGGVVVVPALMLLFGTSDLLARGTSLLMMIPASASGTVSNLRRGNVDVRAAILVGASACLTTALGAHLAKLMGPMASNALFAVFMAFVAGHMVWDLVRHRPVGDDAAPTQ